MTSHPIAVAGLLSACLAVASCSESDPAKEGGGGESSGGSAASGGAGGQGGSAGASVGGGGQGGAVDTPSPLDDYGTAGGANAIAQIGGNLSGNTYNPVTNTHLLILNNDQEIHELDAAFGHLRQLDLTGISAWDLEDIVYLGESGDEHEYALVNENGMMWIGVIPDDSSTSLDLGGFQEITFAPPPAVTNKGPEGVAYDATTGMLWACSERDPMVVYSFTRPAGSGPASYLDNLSVTQPFDAETALGGHITDISSCVFDDRTGRLLVLSHESSRVLDVGLDGTIHGQLELTGAPQYEGIALDGDHHMVLTSEPNWLQVYTYGPMGG